MRLTYGTNTGSNNGVVWTATFVNGRASLSVKLPDRVKFRSGNTGTLHPTFIATYDESYGVQGGILYLPIVEVSVRGTVFRREYTMQALEDGWTFTLPNGITGGVLDVSVALNAQFTTLPRLTNPIRTEEIDLAFGSGAFNLTTDMVRLSGFFAPSEYLSEVELTADETRLTFEEGFGLTGTLVDTVALEIPANKWFPQRLSICENHFRELPEVVRGLAVCTKYRNNSFCQYGVRNCKGHRYDCQGYSPSQKCPFIKARDTWLNGVDELLEVTEDNVLALFNTRTGFGYMADASVPTYRSEQSEGYEFANQDMGNYSQRKIFTMLVQAVRYACHKFDAEAGIPKTGWCFSSDAAQLSLKRCSRLPFWRYIKQNGQLDMSFFSRDQVEIRVKTEDIPVTAYSWVDVQTSPEQKGAGSKIQPVSGLEPSVILPWDLPTGTYEVWAYVKNTLGIAISLFVDTPYYEQDTPVKDPLIVMAPYKLDPFKLLAVPTLEDYVWVKLGEELLSNRSRLSWFINQQDVNAPTAYENPGEFGFKSLYLERIR